MADLDRAITGKDTSMALFVEGVEINSVEVLKFDYDETFSDQDIKPIGTSGMKLSHQNLTIISEMLFGVIRQNKLTFLKDE